MIKEGIDLSLWFENVYEEKEQGEDGEGPYDALCKYLSPGQKTILGIKIKCDLHIYPSIYEDKSHKSITFTDDPIVYKVKDLTDFSYPKFVLLHEIAHSYSVFDEEDADDIALYVYKTAYKPAPKLIENHKLHKGCLADVVCHILLKLWSKRDLDA